MSRDNWIDAEIAARHWAEDDKAHAAGKPYSNHGHHGIILGVSTHGDFRESAYASALLDWCYRGFNGVMPDYREFGLGRRAGR